MKDECFKMKDVMKINF